jgi:macrolide transport system ATP-binding/permease protein
MGWLNRLAGLFRQNRQERELTDELQLHLELKTRENIEAGMTLEEARDAALRAFGGVEQKKEECRDADRPRFIEDLGQDLRYALRLLRKSPGFTAVAVVTLALGIGVNASVFSFLDFMLLRPLSVPEANRVVLLSRGEATLFPYPDYSDYRERSQAFAALAATTPTEATLDVEGISELITAEAVSASYEPVMRVPLMLGRWFTDEDQPVAVISYNAWKRRFHSDPNVLGKQVRSTAQWYTVVGVAPSQFTGIFTPLKTDLWVPLRYWANQIPRIRAEMSDRSAQRVMVFGRLRPGVAPAEAAANLNGIDVQIPKKNSSTGAVTTPLAVTMVRGTSNLDNRKGSLPVVALLTIVVGLVLVIACVDVGNLLLARNAARQREFSLRVALGAGRFRVLRQLMTESLVIAVGAGLSALVLSAWANRLFEKSVPTLMLGISLQLPVDARVVVFTIAVTLTVTLLVGLLPAWHSARKDIFGVLKGDPAPRQRFLLRHAALAGQVAISLILLLSAGLFLRSLLRLQAANPGFQVKNRLYAWTYISPPEFTPESGRRFYARTLEDLRALPGVRSATLTHFLPLLDEGSECVSDGRVAPVDATVGVIDSGYFVTMGIPLLEGRDFSPADGPNSRPVIIVNECLARRFWPGESAVGQLLRVGCQQPLSAEVVGVAQDSKVRSISEAAHPHFYRPFSQNYTGLATLVVETASSPGAMAETIRKTLLGEDKSLRIYALEAVAAHVEHSYWQTRWEASLLLIFGSLALLLAVVGLYGVIAYWVTQRTHEIGVRMAVGARPQQVWTLVLRQGLKITLVGVLIGLTVSSALGRLLSRFLFGVSPLDPVTFVDTALLWMAVAAAACYFPARRASRVDPSIALRYE